MKGNLIMKKVAMIITMALIAFSIGWTHSGRTDKNGGHRNRKTGTYHYHGAPKKSTKVVAVKARPSTKKPASMWTTRSYVDEFGDPTNKHYLTTKERIYGTFSNSTTEGARLRVNIMANVAAGAVGAPIYIQLYEYDRHNPVKTYGKDIYDVRIKTDRGTTHLLNAVNHNDRLHLHLPGYNTPYMVHRLLLKYNTLKFYIIDEEHKINKYSFEVDATGYTAAFKKATKSK